MKQRYFNFVIVLCVIAVTAQISGCSGERINQSINQSIKTMNTTCGVEQ